MTRLVSAAMSMMILGLVACSGSATDETGSSDDALRRGGNKKELTCEAGSSKLALVAIKDGKFALVSLKKAGAFYAVAGVNGAVTSSGGGITWTSRSSSLTLGANLKGTWEAGGRSTSVTCEVSSAADAASFRAANALTDYASEIDGIADAIVETEEQGSRPKAYTVFAVATADRDGLALGEKVRETSGALPGTEDDESHLDENDSGYGAMSAAYSLGGGDDYGEWFQGASDGVSLVGNLGPALKGGTRAGFIARQKVTALAAVVDGSKPSAVEITVGPWTFFLPDAFPK